MRPLLTLLVLLGAINLYAQSASVKGQLQTSDKTAVIFANVVLFQTQDSSLVKVETTNEAGIFHFQNISPGDYFLKASYVGLADLVKNNIQLKTDELLDLGFLVFENNTVTLEEATVTADRVMVEVKPDRTVFNVEGTINSTGADAIGLLRIAPGVTVDNNDNIAVMGRSGVLLYIDGKRLPLTGEDLSAYLQNLTAEQIDRIDIITNPGAKYEAEGNAGIIDIRLKKDKNHGANGRLNGSYSQGHYARYNLGASGNFRNKKMNLFATVSGGERERFTNITFLRQQNNLVLDDFTRFRKSQDNLNYRLGADFFVAKEHTIGVLLTGNRGGEDRKTFNTISIASAATENVIDSVLVANSQTDRTRNQNTANLNYRFAGKNGINLNIDLDYGNYRNTSFDFQPNRYYETVNQEVLLSEAIVLFNAPTAIDIYTFTLDFEKKMLGGKLSLGIKSNRVISDNTFLVFDEIDRMPIQNKERSNIFKYDEWVNANYISFARPINENWSFTAGLRMERTEANGDLQAFLPELNEPPVELSYINWFPNAGLTWKMSDKQVWNLNYGRRINRPDYNVLNPFSYQSSELSSRRGNPRLNPEIVDNVELGYTLNSRYNFKLAYSRTTDQITRLIGPDEEDPRANAIFYDNLATQTVIGFSASAPVSINKIWNAYFKIGAAYLDNQANYGGDAVIDVQVFPYSIIQQHTLKLGGGFKGEVGLYFYGPGVWGGVFEHESSWTFNLGLQRKFFNKKLNVKLSANDIFYQLGWDGVSSFNGLVSAGSGRWDSRRLSLSMSYNFGNQNVKLRKRKTGIEGAAKRVKDGE